MNETQATTTDGRFPLHKLVLGLILLTVGVAALLDAADLWNPRQFWRLWPFGAIALGLAIEIEAFRAREDSGGSMLIGFGTWVLAAMHGVFGLTWTTAFPIGFVVVGFFMVLHAIVDKPKAQPQKKENHHEPC